MKSVLPLLPALAIAVTLAFPGAAAHADVESECGVLEWNYGPFDYRFASKQQKKLVEGAHYTPSVQSATRGATGSLGHDLLYTLSVFPNHPRALLSMELAVQKSRTNPVEGAEFTVECFYERALRFRPDDHIPRMLYVSFLIKHAKLDEAHRHLAYVVETNPENPLTQFNAGMLYIDMKDYDRALVQAHKVMAMGYDRPELRDRLTAVGRWVEPAPVPPADAASVPAAAASAATTAVAPAAAPAATVPPAPASAASR